MSDKTACPGLQCQNSIHLHFSGIKKLHLQVREVKVRPWKPAASIRAAVRSRPPLFYCGSCYYFHISRRKGLFYFTNFSNYYNNLFCRKDAGCSFCGNWYFKAKFFWIILIKAHNEFVSIPEAVLALLKRSLTLQPGLAFAYNTWRCYTLQTWHLCYNVY